MSAANAASRRTAKAGRSWIPWVFVAGFAAVLAVNGALIYFAMGSWAGLADESAFEHGRSYNRDIGEAARQSALGWTLGIALEPVARGSGEVELSVTASDRAGQPLTGLELSAKLERPLGARATIATALVPAADGRYIAKLAVPLRGRWDIHVVARRGSDVDEADGRVFVP